MAQQDNSPRKVTLKQVKPLIKLLWKAGITPFLHSSPGIGKSSVGHQLGKEQNLLVIDLRLTEMEPSDFSGLPFRDGAYASFLPFKSFPTEETVIPDGYEGWLIIIDEFNSANESLQAAAYKFILDHMVGQHKLHPKVLKMACGNLESDNAIVNPMSSALISRFAHFYIELSHKDFMEWAAGTIDIRITSFLGAFPRHLYSFSPDANSPYACPRTWVMLANTINGIKIESHHHPLLASLIGDGIAAELQSFLALYKDIPTIAQIVENPNDIPISKDLGTRWAVMGMVIHHVTEETAEQCELFFKRLSLELQVCALREIKIRNPLIYAKQYRSWRIELSDVVYE